MYRTIATLATAALAAGLAYVTETHHADAHTAPTHQSSTVGVELPPSVSDGNPLEVPRASVTDVRDCAGKGYARECSATLEGYHGRVLVAGVDYPNAPSRRGKAVRVPMQRPPYWHLDPPTWCEEDMPCWIGTKADGRSNAESMADWRHTLAMEPQ